MKSAGSFVPCLSLILFCGLFTAGISSCRHNDDISALPEICFQSEILPIFQTSCAISGCHDGGEFDLSDYNAIIGSVTPGNAMQSRIYTVMTNAWSGNMMPPDRPVPLQNRSKIKVWIEQGAKNSACP
jgi:hypothetical protein